MTSSSSTSHTVTEDLVGPFRDSVVLQPDFQKINREFIEVHELMMLQDKILIGFDDVDLAVPEDDSPVLYRAKLILRHPFTALTSKGRILVEAQLRDMDVERRSRDNLVSGSTISLNRLGSITLLLQGYKAGLQTSFCVAQDDLLLFHTRDQSRKFSVKSLHPLTLANSHIFLGRFRLRALLETAATQPDPPPLHERTPTYLFRALQQRASLPRQRFIYDPNELAAGTSDRRDPAAGSSLVSQTPRDVSKAEIWHIMAQHAEFILADQGKSRKPFLDLPSWLKFTRLARQQRVLARMNGTTEIDWGTVNGDWDAEVDEDNSMEEEVVESVRTILKGIDVFGVPHATLVRTVQSALQRAQRRMGGEEDDELYSPRAVKQEEDVVRHYYASDFSEESSEASSRNGSDSESSYDSSIMDELPESMHEVPKLTGFLWNCGMPKCAYSFDIRDTGDQPGTISAWESFSVTVFDHQSAHLREMGIEAVPRKRGKGIKLQRIKKTR